MCWRCILLLINISDNNSYICILLSSSRLSCVSYVASATSVSHLYHICVTSSDMMSISVRTGTLLQFGEFGEPLINNASLFAFGLHGSLNPGMLLVREAVV